jgi:hypothetical protein
MSMYVFQGVTAAFCRYKLTHFPVLKHATGRCLGRYLRILRQDTSKTRLLIAASVRNL